MAISEIIGPVEHLIPQLEQMRAEIAADITAGGVGTPGSVIFAGAAGPYTQDNSNLFWDDTNNRLGLGTTAPGFRLHVFGTSASPSLSAAAGYAAFRGSSTAQLTIGSYSGSPFGVWLQTNDNSYAGFSYPLILNPLGGNIGVGTTDPSGLLTVNKSGIGSTSTDGILLENTTAAANNAQQYSPRLRLRGYGWGGTSQPVDWITEVVPLQRSASESAPSSYLAFKPQINGAGYSNFVTFHSSGSVGIGLTDPVTTAPSSADPPLRFGRLSIGPLTGHGHMGGSYPFPHGRAIVNVDDEYALGFDLESTNFVNKVVGVASWLVMNPTENAPTGTEIYGGRHVSGVKAGCTKNFYDIVGSDGLAYHDGSGSARFLFGGSFEAQTAFAGTVTTGLVGVHAKVRTLTTATGAVDNVFANWNEVSLTGAQTIASLIGTYNTITVGAGNTSITSHVSGFYMDTPVFTSSATQPYIAFLQGLRIPDLSQFGAKVLAHFNIRSLGVNSFNLLEGTNFQGHQVFGGIRLTTDTAPVLGSIQAQSAYAQATTNVTGGDFILAGGTGRRFFTVVDITLGNTIVTVTVNGTAVTLEGSTSGVGVQFAYGATTTTAATNLAAAINAHATLNVQVTATSSTNIVYLTKKGRCYSLTIATNQVLRISTTSGGDGGIRLQDIPVYANNAAAVAGGLAVGRVYRTNADPDPLMVVH